MTKIKHTTVADGLPRKLNGADWDAEHFVEGVLGNILTVGAGGSISDVSPAGLAIGNSAGFATLYAAASGMVIGAGITRIRTSGHTNAGIGGADYIYDAAVTALNVGVGGNIGTAFLAADGRGFKLDPRQALTFDMFGAIPGDYATGISADCLFAWTRLQTWLAANKRNVSVSFYGGAPEITFPGSQYYFTDTLQMKITMHLRGMGPGHPGGEPTWLRFAANKAGIVVNRYNTIGDIAEAVPTTGADGSIIEGFMIASEGGTPDLLKSGVRMRGRATVRDCIIRSFPGAGVCIVTAVDLPLSDAFHGNANNWKLDTVRAENNKYGGFYVSGGDSNAGVGTLCDATRNGRYGILDTAFLGNTWIGGHTDVNGGYSSASVLQTSIVSDGTHRYELIHGQDALAASTAPTFGTSNAVWRYHGTGGAHPDYPIWVASGITYVSGGAYLQIGSANYSVFNGCYYEGGQAGPQIIGSALVVGGFMGSGLPGGAPHLTGFDGLRSQRKYTQLVTFGSGTTGFNSLGGPVVGNTVPLLQWGSIAATPFNPSQPAFLMHNGDTGDIYWDSYGFRQPFRFTGYSTTRVYQGRPAAENRYITEIEKRAIGDGIGLTPNNNLIEVRGDAVPTTGTAGRGDIVWNTGAVTSIATVDHWRCSVAGTPGTWIAK